jgi:SOS-response transcriptional repressor LexA
MAQEGFKRGDEVLILMTKEVTWSDLTLVAVDDEPACVRHVKQEGEWTIIEGREPRLVQSSSVTLFGKVIEVRRKI